MRPFRPALTLLTLPVLLGLSGCGLFQRSSQATHVEDDSDSGAREHVETYAEKKVAPATPSPQEEPKAASETPHKPFNFDGVTTGYKERTSAAPQQIQDAAADAKDAQALFDRALREEEDGAFLKAAELWQTFLTKDTGLPGYAEATYHYGVCLFTLGRSSEALEPLKNLILETEDGRLANDARILLAESLLQSGKNDEALVTTFDVLPDRSAELRVGIRRSADAVAARPHMARVTTTQKVRLYTIRGRILASLGREDDARSALETAKTLLVHARKGEISSKDMRFLSSNYAWRQIEVQGLVCQHRVPVPERLSEAEFLAYADAYYGCASPARNFFCTVLTARNEQVRGQAVATYRGIVEAPLALRDHLPPPAREIRKPEQRSFYESEMKALIEKTVAARAKEFKDLPSCHAKDVF